MRRLVTPGADRGRSQTEAEAVEIAVLARDVVVRDAAWA